MGSAAELLLGLLVLGPGALVIGGTLAYALGPSPRRMLVVAGLGIPLLLALFLWAWLESSPTEDFWECGEILGHWMSPYFVFYLLVNAAAWVTGAVIGWAVRRTRGGDLRPTAS